MRYIILAALLLVPNAANAAADTANLAGRFGFGFQVGAPFAITGKYWLTKDQALQGYVGTFFGDAGIIGADYVVTFARTRLTGAPLHFGFHIGGGGALVFGDHACFNHWNDRHCHDNDGDDDIALGVRVPLAANMYLDKVPLEIYLELAPVFEIVPDFDGTLTAGLGVRYYF